jgi:iron complex transport system substrate-binding protein
MLCRRLAAVVAALAALYAGAISIPAVAQTTAAGATGTAAATDTSRIVSIGGDVTEILYALGAGDRIVAVDSTSQFPPEALATKKNIGYLRALSTEGVLAVNGSAILASSAAGPPEVVKALKGSSVPYVEVKDDTTPEGIVAKVKLVAGIVGQASKGEAMARDIEARFAQLATARARIPKARKVLFVLNAQGGRAMVGGRNTSADSVIRLAGAENAAASIEGFKTISEEGLAEAQPDVILAIDSHSSAHNVDQLMAMASVQTTPAGRDKRLVRMEPLFLLGFGPRTPEAAKELMARVYPDLNLGATSH